MAKSSRGGAVDELAESLSPLRLLSVPEAVAQKLRDAILAGQLKPGERLVEQKLASRFGIGQPTLREALKELEFQGFVRKSPKKGTYVTLLTPEDFRKIQEVRMSLEVVAIEKAACNMTSQAAFVISSNDYVKFASRPVLSPRTSTRLPMRSSIESQRLLSGVLLA